MKKNVFVLALFFFGVTALAQPTSGKCGKNITWTLQDDGTLVITGAGDTYDYSKKPQNSPFVKNGIADRIKVVDLTRFHADGHLSDNLFYGCRYVELVMLYERQLLSLNTSLFNDFSQLKKVIVCSTINPSKNNYRIMVNNLPNRKDSLFAGFGKYIVSRTSEKKSQKSLIPVEQIPEIENLKNIKEDNILNNFSQVIGEIIYQDVRESKHVYRNGDNWYEFYMQYKWHNGNWIKGKFVTKESESDAFAQIIEYHWNTASRKGDYYIGDIKGHQYFMKRDSDWSFSKRIGYDDFYAEGYGEYHWANGDWYRGDWVNGKREGYGEMHWKRKDKYGYTWYTTYKGEWHNDKMNGEGVYLPHEDGGHVGDVILEGNFKDNLLNGKGSMFELDEGYTNMFYGDFTKGHKNGKGIIYYTMIDTIFDDNYGLWENDEYIGHPEAIIVQDFLDCPTTLPFRSIARHCIGKEINEWQKKQEFETTAEWKIRVTEDARKQKVDNLYKQLQDLYIESVSQRLQHCFQLGSYDADNRTFIVEDTVYRFEDMIISLDNSISPQTFKSSWNKIISVPTYFINGNNIDILEMDFMLYDSVSQQYNRVAHYQKAADLTYQIANVDYQFAPITIPQGESYNGGGNITITKVDVAVGKSDVDQNIPVVSKKNDNTYVFIIANENYSTAAKVPFAINDGSVFRDYCVKTLGVNEKKVILHKDATFGNMTECVERIKEVGVAYGKDANIIFYYAGHAFPDEAERTGHFLPVDGNTRIRSTSYSLQKLFDELGNLSVNSVICFIDACFSGATREDNVIMAGRGVIVKPREDVLKGNLVVFSASSGEETAHQYSDKGHGMFTYYILKKLQDAKGDVTLEELSDYVIDNVQKTSIDVNMKLQTPTVRVSPNMKSKWKSIKLNE